MFRLCLELGYVHPDHLLLSLSASQQAEWEAYDRLEPIGGYREDYRFAQVCLMLHKLMQMQRGDGKHTRADIHDFMLWGPERHVSITKRKSPEELKQMMMAVAQATKGKKS